MGADYIGWRNCPLQEAVGPEGFLGKLKLRAYKGAVESRIPPDQRDEVKIEVQVTNRPNRTLTYPQIVRELDEFTGGIPECASCPISGGKPVGCYRYITYPIDDTFERLVMDFMTEQLKEKDSIGDQLWQDIFSDIDPGGWVDMRGGGPLAELPQPIEIKWGGFFSKKRLTSAHVLAGLFISLEHVALLAAYANFFMQLSSFAEARGITDEHSRTLAELRAVSMMVTTLLPAALEGQGAVLVDS